MSKVISTQGAIEGTTVYVPSLPVGVPFPYFNSSFPAGTLECNGQSFSLTEYPDLAEIYPSGVLPDLRGVVLSSCYWLVFVSKQLAYDLTVENGNAMTLGGYAPSYFASLMGVLDRITFNDFRNFKATVTSNTGGTITADNNPFDNSGALSLTLNASVVGANGLDVGTLSANTWYYHHIIYGIAGTACLLSLSATAPTLPSGYTRFVRTGARRTDASGRLYRMAQYGRKTQYIIDGTILTTARMVCSGAATRWTAVSLSNFIPQNACAVSLSITSSGDNRQVMVAPSSNYGNFGDTANPPYASAIYVNNGNPNLTNNCTMLLESATMYYYSNAALCSVACMGWEDNL